MSRPGARAKAEASQPRSGGGEGEGLRFLRASKIDQLKKCNLARKISSKVFT
jgi:hypothetical protein